MSPRGLDLDAFARWYDAQRPGDLDGELSADLVAGGKSNLTYTVTDGTTTRIVRRPPLGHVQATAHDMVREHTVITALAGTDVPVPATYALCEDPDVLGAPFYVMELVPGTAYRTAEQLEPLGPGATEELATAMVDVLATLHAVDPHEVGLGELGRPTGFLERQVRRWGRQLEGSRSRDLPDADELLRRLTTHVPTGAAADEQGAAIVHGDYRLDNLLVHDGRVTAVLDWEMATLGDPLTDLALLLVYDRLPDLGGVAVADASRAPGYPSGEDLLARYAATSGRDLGRMDFHLGLAYLKLAVILEGIHFRHAQGQTLGEGFASVGAAVPPLLASGLDATADLDTTSHP